MKIKQYASCSIVPESPSKTLHRGKEKASNRTPHKRYYAVTPASNGESIFYQAIRCFPAFVRMMAGIAMLLGFCTAFGQNLVDVRSAAPTVIVAVLTNLTYEPEGGTSPDTVDTNSWQVNGVSPASVHRYSVTWNEDPYTAWNDPGGHPNSFPVTTLHRIYLQLSSPLQEGTTYTISNPNYGSISLTFGSTNTFCESIKVNQAGYSKLSTSRYANYGVFMGDGGSIKFNTTPTYKVYNQNTGAIVTNGTAVYMGDDTGSTGFQISNSGEHVYRLSLNAVPEGGPYYVSVDGAGRSRPFGIGDNYSSNIAYVTLRGMYLHRCGIALTEPYTAFTHAICHTNIYDVRSTSTDDDSVYVPSGTPSMFIQGGYHDAGDMDQSAFHYHISVLMMSFFEAFPNRFTTNQYNIPESGNGIPDFLNEIMWGVKVWEYLQVTNTGDTDYGGVRAGYAAGYAYGNINAPNHYTQYGAEDAANDICTYGTYAVTEDCTAMVAGVFAQASRLIRPYDSAHADALLNRAQLAWSYLTNHYDVTQARTRYAYSALQLYLATSNTTYHNIFQTAISNIMAGAGAPTQNNRDETYAPGDGTATCYTAYFVSYLLPNVPNPNPTLVQNLKSKILYYANTNQGTIMGPPPEYLPYAQGINSANTTWDNYGAGASQGRYADVWMYGCLFTNDPVTLQTWTNAVAQYADFPLGLNPMNMSYYTGLGVDQPNTLLDCDSYYTKYGTNDGVPLPDGTLDNHRDANGNPIGNVPGICIYGPRWGDSGEPPALVLENKLIPIWDSLPPQRRYAHGHSYPEINEFTPQETMAWNLLMYAFLYTPPGGGSGTTRPVTTAQRASGPMTIDGNLSEAGWVITNSVTRTIIGTNNNTVTFGALWDDTYLYVGAKVLDTNLVSDSSPYPWQDDAIEVYIDGNHNRGTSYDSYDRQFVKGWNYPTNSPTIWANGSQTNGVLSAWAYITGGYSVEIAIPWTNFGITPTTNTVIGFDVGNDDDDTGGNRQGQSMWAGTVNNWTDTSAFGDLKLLGTNGPPPPPPSEEFTNDANTIALYHFNGDYNDSSTNGFNLTAFGNTTRFSNPGWMQNPSGEAVRFSDLGDQLVISTVPDSLVEPGPNQTPLTIEARIYVRGYKAYNRANASLISLYEDWDARLQVYDPIYPASGQPIGPTVNGYEWDIITTASQWQSAVSLNTWHKFKLTFAADGTANCYIDGNLVSSLVTSMYVARNTAWTITLGNFDGDIDEVRISNIVR